MAPITLVCIIAGFLSTISSLFRLIRPIYKKITGNGIFFQQCHRKRQKLNSSLKSAQRFLLALALADLCGLILLVIIPLRAPSVISTSTLSSRNKHNNMSHFLLLSAPLVPRPATLATLATLNLLSIIRGRPLRLGPLDAAIWVPAVLTSIVLIAVPLSFTPPRRFSTATAYIILACLLTFIALLVVGAFGRLLLAIIRVGHANHRHRDGHTSNNINTNTNITVSNSSSNCNVDHSYHVPPSKLPELPPPHSPASTEATVVGRNSIGAHNVYENRDDHRPSISSYVSVSEEAGHATGFISSSKLGYPTGTSNSLFRLPSLKSPPNDIESPLTVRRLQNSTKSRLSTQEARSAAIRLGGCLISAFVAWTFEFSFLLMIAATRKPLPSVQDPSILMVLAITLPALLLAVQIIASEGCTSCLAPKSNQTTTKTAETDSKQNKIKNSVSNLVEKDEPTSPSLSVHSAHSFPHMHRPSTSTSLYTRPSTSTKEPRQSYDPLVDVSKCVSGDLHATSSPKPRWKRALSMTAFHPKLLLLAGRHPSISEKDEDKSGATIVHHQHQQQRQNQHRKLHKSRVTMSKSGRCCKSLDLEYGHSSNLFARVPPLPAVLKRFNNTNPNTNNQNTPVIETTADCFSSQVLSRLMSSPETSAISETSDFTNVTSTKTIKIRGRKSLSVIDTNVRKCQTSTPLLSRNSLSETTMKTARESTDLSEEKIRMQNLDREWARKVNSRSIPSDKKLAIPLSDFGIKSKCSGVSCSEQFADLRRRSLGAKIPSSYFTAASSDNFSGSTKSDNIKFHRPIQEDEPLISRRKSTELSLRMGVTSGWLSPPREEEEEGIRTDASSSTNCTDRTDEIRISLQSDRRLVVQDFENKDDEANHQEVLVFPRNQTGDNDDDEEQPLSSASTVTAWKMNESGFEENSSFSTPPKRTTTSFEDRRLLNHNSTNNQDNFTTSKILHDRFVESPESMSTPRASSVHSKMSFTTGSAHEEIIFPRHSDLEDEANPPMVMLARRISKASSHMLLNSSPTSSVEEEARAGSPLARSSPAPPALASPILVPTSDLIQTFGNKGRGDNLLPGEDETHFSSLGSDFKHLSLFLNRESHDDEQKKSSDDDSLQQKKRSSGKLEKAEESTTSTLNNSWDDIFLYSEPVSESPVKNDFFTSTPANRNTKLRPLRLLSNINTNMPRNTNNDSIKSIECRPRSLVETSARTTSSTSSPNASSSSCLSFQPGTNSYRITPQDPTDVPRKNTVEISKSIRRHSAFSNENERPARQSQLQLHYHQNHYGVFTSRTNFPSVMNNYVLSPPRTPQKDFSKRRLGGSAGTGTSIGVGAGAKSSNFNASSTMRSNIHTIR